MSKEQQDLLDKAYETYKTIHKHDIRTEGDRSQLAIESLEKQLIYPQEEFINKCKTDPEFSEKWGLKIEERELSWDERADLSREKRRTYANWPYWSLEEMEYHLTDVWNIPTRLITLRYNDTTIESYK